MVTYGTIFELTYPDWTLVTLKAWSNVEYFSAAVTPDASGNVYGTVNTGAGDGEVFKLTCCWTYTPLHDFSGTDGSAPDGAPVVDAQGNIYGTTTEGGAYGYGVVWEISP
ncbi:MAG: choice-of-anchor tandem repeat GloVer-containing protein [Candidatus Korobacteraceae bacterium]